MPHKSKQLGDAVRRPIPNVFGYEARAIEMQLLRALEQSHISTVIFHIPLGKFGVLCDEEAVEIA